MSLIKILFCMLALALALGIFTSGSPGNADAEEPEPMPGPVPGTEYGEEWVTVNNNSLKENPEPLTEDTAGNTAQNEAEERERNVSFPPATSENTNSAVPEPPAPSILENGTGEIAVRKRILEARTGTAAGLIEEKGEEIFPKFREAGSSWFYGDFYVFVASLDGTLVVYPPNSSKEGMDLKELPDSEGKAIGELFLKTARREEGEGWVAYNWPGPGNSEPSRKHTFIKRAHGKEQTYLIGTGFYPEECIISRNLEECKVLKQEGNVTVSELFNSENTDRKAELECSITHSALGLGEKLSPRLVETSKAIYVLEGEGLLYLDDIQVKLRPGQLVCVPKGSFWTVYNTGNTSLLFLSVNKPEPDEESEKNYD